MDKEEKTVNLEEAIKAMREGKKVYHVNWGSPNNRIRKHNNNLIVDKPHCWPVEMNGEEFFDNSWVIIEEENK